MRMKGTKRKSMKLYCITWIRNTILFFIFVAEPKVKTTRPASKEATKYSNQFVLTRTIRIIICFRVWIIELTWIHFEVWGRSRCSRIIWHCQNTNGYLQRITYLKTLINWYNFQCKIGCVSHKLLNKADFEN